jgi:hypothetical protein
MDLRFSEPGDLVLAKMGNKNEMDSSLGMRQSSTKGLHENHEYLCTGFPTCSCSSLDHSYTGSAIPDLLSLW